MSIIFAGDFLPLRPFGESPFPDDAKLVANLECAISTSTVSSSKAYSMVLGSEAIDAVVQSRFAALSVANNHVRDAGDKALDRMIKTIAQRDGPLLYGTRDKPYAVVTDGEQRCAVIGCLERCRSRGNTLFREEDVASLIHDLAAHHDRVFVTPHWGKEGECASHPSPRQQKLARKWLDAGATAVLGHHSHAFHGRQPYRGSLIYYSLGNLLFDTGESRYPLTRFGLAVTWTAGDALEDDDWRETILFQSKGCVTQLDAECEDLLGAYLEDISADICTSAWNHLRWARAVGPVYIPYSNTSWRRRLHGSSAFRNRLLYLIWCVLPTTVLLRLGYWLPDPRITSRRQRIEDEMQRKLER
ncbi:MAG: CapA family protein [Chloroflexi bacterium]|nr:CapA family protein [Chloroflexota bacterium]